MRKEHKWWHFIYGKETKWETVFKGKNSETNNYWDICKKCGEQVGEKQGCTTFQFGVYVSDLTKEAK